MILSISALVFLLFWRDGSDGLTKNIHPANTDNMSKAGRPMAISRSPTATQVKVNQTVYKPSSIKMGEGATTVVEIDHGLRKIDLVDGDKYPAAVIDAQEKGALGAVTFRVVDDRGLIVPDAIVRGAFWNHGKKGYDFEQTTEGNGLVALQGTCVGDLNFSIVKDGHYETRLRYWFFKACFDCVENGRWIPWNPTIEIVLKEKREPIPLYTKEVEKSFPKNETVGFDCLCGDFIAPWGTGARPDFRVKYESVRPPIRAGTKYPDFSYFTNNLVLFAEESGGFITKPKDTFSRLVSEYEAPEDGYVGTIDYEMKRTHDKIFVNRKLDGDKYLFFRSRMGRMGAATQGSAHYGKIYRLGFGESLKETNSATLKMSYYFNPTPSDRNLEFDGKNNLFKPDWRDNNWPKEP